MNPVAFQLGPLSVRWYGLLYGAALISALFILKWLNARRPVFKNNDQLFDLVFWIFLIGVIAGGRLGYVLFYNLSYFIEYPLKIPALWEGGMSFHGGLIGSVLIAWFFCRQHKIPFLATADLFAVPAALAQGIGRFGNLINRELMGRAIENPRWEWLGMDFGDGLLRFPSPVFQAAALFLLAGILLFLFPRTVKTGTLFSAYLILSGLFRFITEFWRAPDPQIGFIGGFFTLGQLLALAVTAAGLLLFRFCRR